MIQIIKKNEKPKEPERSFWEKLWDTVTFSKPCAAAERDGTSYNTDSKPSNGSCFDAVSDNKSSNETYNDPLNLYNKKPWETVPDVELPKNESYICPDPSRKPGIEFNDWVYDVKNFLECPVEDKLEHFVKYLYDRWYKLPRDYFRAIGVNSGMGPYADIYGDFAAGSMLESGITVLGSGYKSVGELIRSEEVSKKSVIAGCGAGNLVRFKNEEQLCKACEGHIFSNKHIKGGIMDLGESRQEIMDSALNIVKDADAEGLLFDGSTQIKTSINGYDAEVRINLDNENNLRSFDVFKGHSSVDKGHTIYYKCQNIRVEL